MENISVKPVSTTFIGIKYGVFAGVAGALVFILAAFLGSHTFQGVWSWVVVCLFIFLLFLAHKKYKDTNTGFMSYGQGILIAVWFTLTFTIVATLVQYFYISLISFAPMQLLYDQQLAAMKKAKAPEEAIEMGLKWTKKLFWLFHVFGLLVRGMIIALILTIFTQKKGYEPTF